VHLTSKDLHFNKYFVNLSKSYKEGNIYIYNNSSASMSRTCYAILW